MIIKQKLNMIGGGFQHDICSSALNKNKYVEWMKDNSAPVSIYIDNAILGNTDKTKINYGWLAESSAIIPDTIKIILSNLTLFKEKYTFIFTHDRRLIDVSPQFFKFVVPNAKPWIQNKNLYKKTKLTSFIGSNKIYCIGHSYRQQMISKYKDVVDHYGRGFYGKELPWTYIENNVEESGKLIGLKDYMFSIVMENDNYDDIFCEKITDCFAAGTIPVYWGTKNIKNYFDINGIIILDDKFEINMLTKEIYYSKIEHIKNNFNKCHELLTSEDYMVLNHIK